MSFVWINGQLVDKSEAKISVFDHGFLYGDGVWEHFRAFNGKLFRAEAGMWLFLNQVRASAIEIPFSSAELIAAIESTLRANDRLDGYIRVIASRGSGTIGPDPRKLDPIVIIVAEEYQPFPAELYSSGLHVVVAEPSTWSHGRPPLSRSLGQQHFVMAKAEAISRGCLEAVLMDECGSIYGTTEGQMFGVVDGSVLTLPGRLLGLEQSLVEDLARVAEVPFGWQSENEFRFTGWGIDDDSEEYFIAGTACGIIGVTRVVTSVDEHVIGTGKEGPITRRIREAYRKLTRGEL